MPGTTKNKDGWMIEFECPGCGHRFQADGGTGEAQVSCASCGQSISIPPAAAEASGTPGDTFDIDGLRAELQAEREARKAIEQRLAETEARLKQAREDSRGAPAPLTQVTPFGHLASAPEVPDAGLPPALEPLELWLIEARMRSEHETGALPAVQPAAPAPLPLFPEAPAGIEREAAPDHRLAEAKQAVEAAEARAAYNASQANQLTEELAMARSEQMHTAARLREIEEKLRKAEARAESMGRSETRGANLALEEGPASWAETAPEEEVDAFALPDVAVTAPETSTAPRGLKEALEAWGLEPGEISSEAPSETLDESPFDPVPDIETASAPEVHPPPSDEAESLEEALESLWGAEGVLEDAPTPDSSSLSTDTDIFGPETEETEDASSASVPVYPSDDEILADNAHTFDTPGLLEEDPFFEAAEQIAGKVLDEELAAPFDATVAQEETSSVFLEDENTDPDQWLDDSPFGAPGKPLDTASEPQEEALAPTTAPEVPPDSAEDSPADIFDVTPSQGEAAQLDSVIESEDLEESLPPEQPTPELASEAPEEIGEDESPETRIDSDEEPQQEDLAEEEEGTFLPDSPVESVTGEEISEPTAPLDERPTQAETEVFEETEEEVRSEPQPLESMVEAEVSGPAATVEEMPADTDPEASGEKRDDGEQEFPAEPERVDALPESAEDEEREEEEAATVVDRVEEPEPIQAISESEPDTDSLKDSTAPMEPAPETLEDEAPAAESPFDDAATPEVETAAAAYDAVEETPRPRSTRGSLLDAMSTRREHRGPSKVAANLQEWSTARHRAPAPESPAEEHAQEQEAEPMQHSVPAIPGEAGDKKKGKAKMLEALMRFMGP